MKRIFCLLLSVFILFTVPMTISADAAHPWESEYARIIHQTQDTDNTKYILADFDYNDTPELYIETEQSLAAYTFTNNSLVKTAETTTIPIRFIENLRSVKHNESGVTEFLGQIASETEVVTFKMTFAEGLPALEVIATENADGSGTFYGVFETDCSGKVSAFLAQYTQTPFTLCVLNHEEIIAVASKEVAVNNLFDRYHFLRTLPDDTQDFSAEQQEAIKNLLSGTFLRFDKITHLNSDNVFAQYDTAAEDVLPAVLSGRKQYVVLSKNGDAFSVLSETESEQALDINYLSSLKTQEHDASNVYIDYEKTNAFRGIDDYVTYLATILSNGGKNANENGKMALADYMEYAVTKSSRTQVKANNNVITINNDTVSFIAENAVSCMNRLTNLCNNNGVSQIRTPRMIPELVLSDVDVALPVRFEFSADVKDALGEASGIRLMLDDTRGFYIEKADLEQIFTSVDSFSMQYSITGDTVSVVFADKNNQFFNRIAAPVWLIVPAQSVYSTVMAKYTGGVANWGGQFDPQRKTLTFSTNYTGDYYVIKNDIAINDIASLPQTERDAIQFLVSKGIFTLDTQNNFRADEALSRYAFTTALVKMLYAVNAEAETSFTDVPKENSIYRYVATAEMLQLINGYEDGTFRGEESVSKEQLVALCGRLLVEKKGYAIPGSIEDYLKFTDSNTISDWAKQYVAVAVQCGLISNAGTFAPQSVITRTEAASILYKTFMRLYDVTPVTTVSPSHSAEVNSTEIILAGAPQVIDFEFRIAVCIIVTVVLLFIGYLMVKWNQHKKKKEEKKKLAEKKDKDA